MPCPPLKTPWHIGRSHIRMDCFKDQELEPFGISDLLRMRIVENLRLHFNQFWDVLKIKN